jgi:hypothetical protein
MPAIGDVVPGLFTVHQYTPEVCIVLRVNGWYDSVEVLLGTGKIVKWSMEGFRSVYREVVE